MDSSSQEPSVWSWEESLKTAIHCNITLSEYEEMTPYELSLFAETYLEKEEMRQQEQVVLVWLGEYYHRQKILPSLKKALNTFFDKHSKQMSDDEMLQTVMRLNAKFQGNIETKSGD